MKINFLQIKGVFNTALFILLMMAGMSKVMAQQPQIKVSEINLSNIGSIEERVFMVHSILEKGYYCYKNLNLSNTIDIYVTNDASDEMSDFDFYYDNLLYNQLDEFIYLDKTTRGELFVEWRQEIDDDVYNVLYEDFTQGVRTENATCESALPFSTDNGLYQFSAGVNSGSPCGGTNYTCSAPYACTGTSGQSSNCLYTAPNPAFYYMQINQSGDLNIKMYSTPLVDIDFDCWGPFDNITTACGQLSCNNIVDCSYSTAATEYCHINNAETGQYYVLLITNYSNQSANIFFENIGTGSTVTFQGIYFDISVMAYPIVGGIVSGGGEYEIGSTCTVTALANDGYAFMYWTENGQPVSYDAEYSFTVTNDRNLIANFAQPFSITAQANPEVGGTITGEGGYYYGSTCTLTAIANEGFCFYYWSENGQRISTNSEYSFAVTAPRNLVARFRNSDAIAFVDPNVESICLTHWDTNSDGELSYAEAAAVIDLGNVFAGNDIISFDELRYFIGLTTIDYHAFHWCTNLTSIEIPNSIISIGSYSFSFCYSLTSIKIPDSVTSISTMAFHSCISLTSLTIGNSVTSIGNYAFSGCTGLTSIFSFAETPPVLNEDVFSNVSTNIPVHVLCAATETYQTTVGWSDFTNIVGMCPGTITVAALPEEGGTVTGGGLYEGGSTCILTAFANSGYHFVNWMESGTVISSDEEYSFVVTGNRNIVANFEHIPKHWNVESNFQNSMFVVSVVMIDSIVQATPTIELGAFCNGECRGSEFPVYNEGQWMYFMAIGGNNGDDITFRLYDHTAQEEINLYCYNVLPFVEYAFIGVDNPYEVLFVSTIDISIDVNPVEAGIVLGAGAYASGTEITLTAIANEGYAFNSWTINGEIVSTNPCYTFSVTAPVSLTANFNVVYYVSINVNLEDAGIITGAGAYAPGTQTTLTATANEGYVFNSWTIDGEIVSTESSYTFMVTESVNLTANFEVVQTLQFSEGWNWFSTYLDITMDDLKAALVATGSTFIMIKSKNGITTYNGETWRGQLDSLDVTQMYKISVGTDCEIILSGTPINPAEHPVTIHNGANWIGFPLSENMILSDAFAGFAVNGDMIKSKTNGSAAYYGTMWRGALNTLVSGQGYIYKSNVQSDRTFTFPIGTK